MFCLIFIDISIFWNININLRFYIWYANVLIAAFTSAYLYPGMLTVTSILHTSYKCSAQSRNRYNSRIVLRKVGILTLLCKVGILTLRKTILELHLRKVGIGTKWEYLLLYKVGIGTKLYIAIYFKSLFLMYF